MTDNEIIEYIKQKNCKRIYFDKIKDKNVKQYLVNRYNDSQSLAETYYRILHNIEIRPTCPYCDNSLHFRSLQYGYNKTCKSKECKTKHSQFLLKSYSLEKYGVENYFQSKEIIEKIKHTFIERYGKHPKLTKEIQNKYEKTCLEKYGVNNAFKSKEVQNKYKETMIKKHGCEHNWQIPEEQVKSHSKEALQKCWETQKKNGTINKSKEEDKSYELLKEVFSDVERNYKCNRYPFSCDFYIPSLDLFIECQYSMFHNGKPYTGSEKDILEIESIKEKSEKRKQITGKNTTRYDAIINTWTIRDVNKRNIAKQNNLNYLEFFTILKLQEWLNKYKTNE